MRKRVNQPVQQVYDVSLGSQRVLTCSASGLSSETRSQPTYLSVWDIESLFRGRQSILHRESGSLITAVNQDKEDAHGTVEPDIDLMIHDMN